MALTASGQLSLGDIATEMGVSLSNVSLTTQSTTDINTNSESKPDGSTPHAVSEFYSYDHSATSYTTDGLVFHIDAGNTSSYPGSGTTWTDLETGTVTTTLTNGPTYSSNNGGIINFDGVNDTGEISSLTAYSHTQAHTYEAFVSASHNNTGYRWLLNNGGLTGGTSAIYNTNTGVGLGVLPRFFYDGGNAVVNCKDGGSNKWFPFGWHHFVYRYNGNQTVTFFVDGVEYNTIATGRTWTATNSNPRFGAWYNGNSDAKFSLGVFRVYSKALTSTEVTTNYDGYKSRYGLT
jgi:hypothetical protein